jgi:hypothetical protein
MALLWSGMETTPALAAPGYSLCTHRETTDYVRVTGGRRSKVTRSCFPSSPISPVPATDTRLTRGMSTPKFQSVRGRRGCESILMERGN